MRITEKRLRQIIREEALNESQAGEDARRALNNAFDALKTLRDNKVDDESGFTDNTRVVEKLDDFLTEIARMSTYIVRNKLNK